MTGHTPGPWKAGARTVTAAETCDRLGMSLTIHGGNANDNRANARLIAASPCLLEAAKRVTAAFRAMGESRSLVASISALRAECEASVLALDAAAKKAAGEQA